MSSHPWTRYSTIAAFCWSEMLIAQLQERRRTSCVQGQSKAVHQAARLSTALAPAQDVREHGAAQLVAAMEDSQRSFAPAKAAAATRPDAKSMKRAEQALHKCSPLTVKLLSSSQAACLRS